MRVISFARKPVTITALLIMTMLYLFYPITAKAVQYKYGNDRELYITGYISSMLGFGLNGKGSWNEAAGEYQVDGNKEGLNQALLTFYGETQLVWGRNLEFRTAWRMQGDQISDFKDGDTWDNSWGQAHENINFDDSFNDILREFNIAYFTENFNCRIGKQSLVWGEVDGLRIMDQVNPLDLRRGFIFYDSDSGFGDSRIPLWMAKTEFTTSSDFDFGGLTELGLELSWIPDVDQENIFHIGPREGGIWCAPLAAGVPFMRQLTVQHDFPSRNIDNGSFAGRIKGNFRDTFFTLNYFYGWSADGYLAPGPTGTVPLAALDPTAPPGVFTNGLFFSTESGNVSDYDPAAPINTELVVKMKTYRQKTAGFTLSRQLGFFQPIMKAMNQHDLPVLRIEALYQFDKIYNTATLNLLIPGATTKLESDEIRWMMGLDFFALRIPWINSKDKVTLSTQFIHFHIVDHDDAMNSAPYDWPLKEDFIAWSVLVGSSYYKQKIRPQVIYVRDTTYNSWFIKPRVQYDITDSWRVEAGAYFIDGNKSERQFGLFRDRDSIYTKLTYQF